jgi:phosphoserine phosphatase
MQNVLTLIAADSGPGLEPVRVEQACHALVACGADVGPANWLAPTIACDIPFEGPEPAKMQSAIAAALSGTPVDIVIQDVQNRRKKLLLADMDSTIVTSETLDELAAQANIKNEIAAITQRAMLGEIAFDDALRDRVAMLKGLPIRALEATLAKVEVSPGARVLVNTMRANGAYTVLVSGGLTYFSGRIADRIGFDTHRGNELEISAGALTGKVKEPVFGRNGKLATLHALAADRDVPLALTLAVGDGANDLPMLEAAGLGVAYRAKPIAADGASARVNHGGLDALLYLQGYRRDEFTA